MEFEENNEEIEGNSTRNLKEKQKKFFTRVTQFSKKNRLNSFFIVEIFIFSELRPRNSNLKLRPT
jgi:hypothetical protein